MQLPVSSLVLLVAPPVVLFLLALAWWLAGPGPRRREDGAGDEQPFRNP